MQRGRATSRFAGTTKAAMSFLAPLFLLGGLAIALPVVFHLVRRSSREKLVFSSLMFLKPTPPRMTRRNRLENVFLLLLRCLVICMLSLGFARPFFQKPMAATPVSARRRANRACWWTPAPA